MSGTVEEALDGKADRLARAVLDGGQISADDSVWLTAYMALKVMGMERRLWTGDQMDARVRSAIDAKCSSCGRLWGALGRVSTGRLALWAAIAAAAAVTALAAGSAGLQALAAAILKH